MTTPEDAPAGPQPPGERSGRIVVHEHGGPEVLEWELGPLPEPGPGEVRIRVEAACANFTDVLVRRGLYPSARKTPVTPGYDFVGRIEALGEGVEGWRVGDRVADLLVVGGYSEHLVRRADDLVRVPEAADAGQAAALVLTWTTAYQLLHRAGTVAPGMKILIHAAGGAVGRAMLDLLAGLDGQVQVYGTAREHHHDFLRSRGATPIDYTVRDWKEQADALLPGGFDLVYDSVGTGGYRKSWRSLRPGGKLVAFGFTDKAQTGRGSLAANFLRLFLWRLLPNRRRATFYAISNRGKRKRRAYTEDLTTLLAMLEQGAIQPAIADRLPLRQAAAAHRRIERGGLRGKLVLEGSASTDDRGRSPSKP